MGNLKKMLEANWSGVIFDVYIQMSLNFFLLTLEIDTFIEEGRAASKSPSWKFGYLLSISQQAVSADIISNSAQKQKEQR